MVVSICNMMIYRKYLFGLLVQIFGLTTFAITSVVMLTQFLKFINQYIGKGLDIISILLMLTLILPPFLLQIVPITLFCAIIFVYQKLITDNELVVMETSGISRFKLATPVAFFALMVTLASYATTFFINPHLYRIYDSQKTSISENYISSILEEKVFNTISKNLTIYINNQLEDGYLSGVIIYDQRDITPAIITAQTAKLKPIKNALLIELYKGSRQHLNSNNQLEILFFDSSSVVIQYNKLKEIKHINDPSQLYINELIFNSTEDKILQNSINFEINKRLSWPLVNLALAAIAISTVLSTHYNRTWKGKNTILGSATATLTIFLNLVLTNKSENSTFFAITLYIAPLLVIWLSFYVLKKKDFNNEPITQELKRLLHKFMKLASHLRYK